MDAWKKCAMISGIKALLSRAKDMGSCHGRVDVPRNERRWPSPSFDWSHSSVICNIFEITNCANKSWFICNSFFAGSSFWLFCRWFGLYIALWWVPWLVSKCHQGQMLKRCRDVPRRVWTLYSICSIHHKTLQKCHNNTIMIFIFYGL